MTEYDPSKGKIVTLGDRIISVERAERLASKLESAVETAREYEASPELHDVAMNEMALDHLLDPVDNSYPLKVGISYETDEGSVAEDLLDEVTHRSPEHGLLDGIIDAPDIRELFDKSEGLEGFHVQIPESM